MSRQGRWWPVVAWFFRLLLSADLVRHLLAASQSKRLAFEIRIIDYIEDERRTIASYITDKDQDSLAQRSGILGSLQRHF